jgi:hypothetical protein
MGVEHVYVEYDPAKPTNRYDLGTRRLVHTIELEHFKITPPPTSSVITSFVSTVSGTTCTLTAVFTTTVPAHITAMGLFPITNGVPDPRNGVVTTVKTDVQPNVAYQVDLVQIASTVIFTLHVGTANRTTIARIL